MLSSTGLTPYRFGYTAHEDKGTDGDQVGEHQLRCENATPHLCRRPLVEDSLGGGVHEGVGEAQGAGEHHRQRHQEREAGNPPVVGEGIQGLRVLHQVGDPLHEAQCHQADSNAHQSHHRHSSLPQPRDYPGQHAQTQKRPHAGGREDEDGVGRGDLEHRLHVSRHQDSEEEHQRAANRHLEERYVGSPIVAEEAEGAPHL